MTAIASEIERFNRWSATWWDPAGPMRPLHVVNELRLGYVTEKIRQHLHAQTSNHGLSGLRILDVGCGGGLLSEALARLGAQVVGVDASPGNVEAAKMHAVAQGVKVDYRLGDSETALNTGERFDVVLALEVVEHVDDVPNFLSAVARCVAPGGLLIVSTIDRTWKSFFFAIVGAEYVLRVLPRNTHRWSQFVRPVEVETALTPHGLQPCEIQGMQYNPLRHTARWCRDTRVNYISVFRHLGARERS